MTGTTMSSREFNQDTGRAKRAAVEGPVFITDRGKPAHVLLSIDEYRRLTGSHGRIADLLSWPGAEAIDLPLDRAADRPEPADLG